MTIERGFFMEKIINCIFFEDVFMEENTEPYQGKFYKDHKKIRDTILTKFDDRHLFRKSLTCQFDNKIGKSVFIILMNPSYADNSGLDGTLDNVYKFLTTEINPKKLDNEKYSKFEVLNIFPIRMAQSSCLPCLLERYDKDRTYCQKNTEYIKERLNAKPEWDVIVAWGKDYHLYNETQSICELLKNRKNIYAYNLNGNGNYHTPSHFTKQVYNNVKEKKLIPISFEKFKKSFYIIENDII